MTAYMIKTHLQRWWLELLGITTRDDCVYYEVSSPEITAGKTRYHLCNTVHSILHGSGMTACNIMYNLYYIKSFPGQRWLCILWRIISRDDCVYYEVSSPEIMAGKMRYHLYYIESFQGQRWRRKLWGIISRDNGWKNEVSSLQYCA